MRKKVILSADSTCDLNSELKEKYKVNYFPLHIILEEQDYLDNVTISTDEIYKVFYEKKILPKTAAVNMMEYFEYFKKWTDEGYEVIHLNIGSALSSSYQNSLLAAMELEGVYPIDSCNLSTGIGLLVIQAAKLIEQGYDGKTIQKTISSMVNNSHASFILDTLTFMSAGGRCSQLTAFGAAMLNLKPCIMVDNATGAMNVGKKYRGKMEHVLPKYVTDTLNDHLNIDYERIFITHSGIEQSMIDLVKNTIMSQSNFENIEVTKASCTISSHCGPNTLGILFMTK